MTEAVFQHVRVSGKKFERSSIAVDNSWFENCWFEDCELFYSGGPTGSAVLPVRKRALVLPRRGGAHGRNDAETWPVGECSELDWRNEMAYRSQIEQALDELISEEGGKFQGLAIVLAKQKRRRLVACERICPSPDSVASSPKKRLSTMPTNSRPR
jgi:hypothetical protein